MPGGGPYQQGPYQQGPQFQPGQAPYGAPGYGYGPPGNLPPKGPSKAPLVIGGAVLVVALLVIFVGGFAWPGWFTGNGGKSTSSGPTSATAQVDAQRFVTAINQQDSTTLHGYICDEAQSSVSEYVNLVLQNQVHAALKDSPQMDSENDSFSVTAKITAGGVTTDYISYWSIRNNVDYCMMSIVKDITEPSGGGS